MEISLVRKQLVLALERSKARAQQRRQRAALIQEEYQQFLDNVAVPVARQLCQILKAEGYPFTVFTPSGGVRLASDHGRDDYVELTLDMTHDPPQVIGRTSRVRGSRTLTTERPVQEGVDPASIGEERLLTYFIEALEPWFER